MSRRPVPVDARYGRLVVVREVAPDKWGHTIYECRCDCGESRIAGAAKLREGRIKSCGCLQREARHLTPRTHGMRDHPLYRVWRSMRTRCLNPNDQNYHRYGGRGITISDRWNDFALFVEDMGERPAGTLADGRAMYSIERRDNDGPYSPENCYWATPQEQRANQSLRTHCRHGHELTTANAYVRRDGTRACRECHNARQRRVRAEARREKTAQPLEGLGRVYRADENYEEGER